MCGIYGQFTPRGSSLSHEESLDLAHRLTDVASRRGPDAKGHWSAPGRCYLGFRRLSILDLTEAANQPMLSPDKKYALVINGEIYNFKSLRAELKTLGYAFRSTGDSEVALNSLIHWGEGALKRFNGMFALGFYNRSENSLLLARDPLGIKPLYYYSCSDGIVFGSEFPQILGHPWARGAGVSERGFSLYLRMGFIPPPYSILENASMLEPGACLRVKDNHVLEKRSYFTYPAPVPDLKGNDAFEAVDRAVTESVRRQMVSDVPIGCFLSGGIDSPLVAAKMRSEHKIDFTAFTIGSTDSQLDESRDARRYASQLGCRYQQKIFSEPEVLGYLQETAEACGEPLADDSVLPTLMVSKLASSEVKVILSGDGGDELFWGYADRFSSVLKTCGDFSQARWLRSLRWGLKKHLGLGSGHWNLRLNNIGEWYRLKHSFISQEWQKKLFPHTPDGDPAAAYFEFEGHRRDETAQWLRRNELSCHLQRVLLKVDRASMRHSLEVRVPLLDMDLIELSARVDWNSCLDLETGRGKIPLRESLNKHISHQTLAKKGFSMPMAQWLRGPLKTVFNDAFSGRRDLLGFPLSRSALNKVWNEHQTGQRDFGRFLWCLLNLVFWEKEHFRR